MAQSQWHVLEQARVLWSWSGGHLLSPHEHRQSPSMAHPKGSGHGPGGEFAQ